MHTHEVVAVTNPLAVVVSPRQVSEHLNARPRIIGIKGNAGSGKDTVGRIVKRTIRAETISLADPMKEFAQKVFGFSDAQLWGPSHLRNAPDQRLSMPDLPTLADGIMAKLGHWFHHTVLKKYDEEFDSKLTLVMKNRKTAQDAFAVHSLSWARQITPPNACVADVAFALKRWMAKEMTRKTITPRQILQTLGTEFGRSISEDIWIRIALEKARRVIESGRVAVITDVRFLNEAKALFDSGNEVWDIQRPSLPDSSVLKHSSEQDQNSEEMAQYVTNTIHNNGTVEDLEQAVVKSLTVVDE